MAGADTIMKSLKRIGLEAHDINQQNGWEVFTEQDWPVRGEHNVMKLCTHMALVHSEVSEATEAIRNNNAINFAEELADVIIRVASIAYGLGISLEAEIGVKLEKNATRGYKHGGKAI
jgi:NTP pyrophosphatase (non-canonical NTP hydrolase)